MKEEPEIEINLDSVEKGLKLCISPKKEGTLFDGFDSALHNNEARFQLIEGCFYDYAISDNRFILGDVGINIIQRHTLKQNIGTISPNIFVGTLEIPVFKKDERQKCASISLEVQSVQPGYRDDYREMLEFITEKSAEFLLESNSPVLHHFELEYPKDSQKLYQMFSFIQSLVSSVEFKDAIHKILIAPSTKWSETYEQKDVRSIRRFSNGNVKDLVKGGRRTKLTSGHYLREAGLKTITERIASIRKIDSVDTSENRFVKHALQTFLKVFSQINNAAPIGSKLDSESNLLINQLESQLHQFGFKDISRLTSLKLNSPILQRKEGYCEVLKTWLRFELAVKLIWQGGEDVYGDGKKDIAILYEYWLFFKLLGLFHEMFKIDTQDLSRLFEKSEKSLNLRITQGSLIALKGVFEAETKKVNIQFNYNRAFNYKNQYPHSGSWTTTLRPNYTLSFWPFGVSEIEAEKQELIVHVHFDAKYKIADITDSIRQDIKELDEEKIENRKGIYKKIDLIKMHAYKDAIRGTDGVYVLYPGYKTPSRKEFLEISPGLGAFSIRPSNNDGSMNELKTFILEILDQFGNHDTQSEKLALCTIG